VNKTILIILGVIVVLAMALFGTYNSLVRQTTAIDGQWAQVETQYQRRFDLIPNLVNAVKAYAKHEKTIFEEIADARVKAMGAQSVHDKDIADGVVKDSIGKILAIAENYPELQASDDFVKLQGALTDTEDTIASARKYYNGTVRNLNIKARSFPDMIIAGMAGFKPRDFFEADEEEREPVSVKV